MHSALRNLIEEVVEWNTEKKNLENLKAVLAMPMLDLEINIPNSYNRGCQYLQDHEAQ
jgi:hypothetical protein